MTTTQLSESKMDDELSFTNFLQSSLSKFLQERNEIVDGAQFVLLMFVLCSFPWEQGTISGEGMCILRCTV